MKNIETLRHDYGNTPLIEKALHSNPLIQFEKWFQEALKAQVFEPNGMVLATVSSVGRPSSRTVLLKRLNAEGFGFFTDYESRKGEHLTLHPYGSLTFWWKEIYRQVNIEGEVMKMPLSEGEAYFRKRPKNAQIAARASHQSAPLASREALEEEFDRLQKTYRGKVVQKPKRWGGYLLLPERVEFWQGRKNRLHDRFLYVKVDNEWIISRLSP
jgi:pyridoxamine 5'-phosphate oxidase